MKKVLILSKFDAYWRVINDILTKNYKSFKSCKEVLSIISMEILTGDFDKLFLIDGLRIDSNTCSERIAEYLSDLNSLQENNIVEQIIEENFVNFNSTIDIREFFVENSDSLDIEKIFDFVSDKIPEIVMMEVKDDTYSTIWEYSNKRPEERLLFCKKLFAKICSQIGDHATAERILTNK